MTIKLEGGYACFLTSGSYETACEEYIKALDNLSPDTGDLSQRKINAPIIEFIVNRVSISSGKWSNVAIIVLWCTVRTH